MNIRELLKSSLRVIGAINPHQVPTNNELKDTLEAMNIMLENWTMDGMMVNALTEENFPLSINVGEYTIGIGGMFNTERPYAIIGAFIRSGTVDHPVEIITQDEFNAIVDKSVVGMPYLLNYFSESPLGIIRVFFTPNIADSLHIQTQKRLAEITDLDAEITLEDGYKAAIKWNLALEIAPEWNAELSQIVVERAQQTKNIIMALNAARQFATPAKLNIFGDKSNIGQTILTF